MSQSSINHQGLSDAVNLFNSFVSQGKAGGEAAADAPFPFSDLLAARQISLLETDTPNIQNLDGTALQALAGAVSETLLSDAALPPGSGNGLPPEAEEVLPVDVDLTDLVVEDVALPPIMGIQQRDTGIVPPVATAEFQPRELGADKPSWEFGPGKASRDGARATEMTLNVTTPKGEKLIEVETGKPGLAVDKNPLMTSSPSKTDSSVSTFAQVQAAVGRDRESVKSGPTNLELNLDAVNLHRQLPSQASATAVAKMMPQFHIAENAVTDPAWEQAMTARIGWMSNNGVHSATLKLNPQELGSIHIKLNVDGDQANVHFHTEHRDTQEMIERLMPRLHAAMDAQGIKLDDVKVSHNSQLNANQGGQSAFANSQGAQGEAQSRSQGGAAQSAGGELAAADTLAADAELNSAQVTLKSGVDYYA